MQTPRANRGLLASGLLLGLFALGMTGAIASTGWDTTWEALGRLGVAKLPLLLAFSLTHYFLRALRWHLLARAGGLPTTLRQNSLHYFGGFAMTATPGRLGELVRLRWIGRETGVPFERSASVALADRAVELAGIGLLITLAISLSSLGTNSVWLLVAVAVLMVWVVSQPRLLAALIVRLWRLVGRWPRLFVRLRRMASGLALFLRPQVLITTVGLSMIGWFSEGIAFYVLLSWLGEPIGLWPAVAIFLSAVLSGALSGLPGGLGGTEAALTGLLLLQGTPIEIALLATAIIRVTTLWFAVLIGICVFPLAEARARRAAHS